ncbi:probable UDP-glucosyl transferase 73B6 [Cornus florida]|uniref:probable UDP-glucosyl transferase 73B6 n=1 Tax=Cornus florida TaxID=4283 RepID=UPI00289FE163|nr:probable UDP-glucosyl transferase 73B6 [Cornus florida]
MVMASASPPHVVIFPYMAVGHTLPLLDLSKALSRHGLKITIITTPSNAPCIHSMVSNDPQISLSIIPFPRVEELPEGCENTACLPSMDLFVAFAKATKKLKVPFEGVLKEMSEAGCRPICVISDFFLGWTLDSCRSLGIPRLVSHGMGLFSMAASKAACVRGPSISAMLDSDPVHFPELEIPFTLTKADLPDTLKTANGDDPWLQLLAEVGEADANSWGIIVNSFEEIEGEYVAALESFYMKAAKAWCVGPLLLFNEFEKKEKDQCCSNIKWLDKQLGAAVIYVSFGTQAHVTDMQMDEIALGLEMAGHPFLWVIRSTTWSPPDGWAERVKERGLIVRNWAEQRRILAHPSTGGFLSHCGWNSALESLSLGVPLLAWSMGAEQQLNAKFVAVGLGVGLLIPHGSEGGSMTVGCDVICNGVKKLMNGGEGKKARERAQALQKMARQAVEKGGSSDKKLNELIKSLTHK